MSFDINDTSPRDQYTATAGQTVFTVSFEFLEDADLKVYQTADGVDPSDSGDILTLSTHYAVVGAGSNSTKEITLVSGATLNDVITIARDDGIDRDTEFLSNGDLTIASMNAELNKIITLMQQVEMNQEQRSLMFQASEQLTGFSNLWPKPEANKYLTWSPTAKALVNTSQTVSYSAITDTSADTVAAMMLLSPATGITISTKGYYAVGDGGGANYIIVAPQAFDGFGDHELANNNIAVLQVAESANVKLFGAVGDDGSADDSAAVNAALTAHDSIFFPPGNIYELKGIAIDGGTEDGTGKRVVSPQGAILQNKSFVDGTSMFIFGQTSPVNSLDFDVATIQVGVGGGHVFDFQGWFNHNTLKVTKIKQEETGKSIINHNDTSFFFNRILGLFWTIMDNHTVSAIYMTSTSNLISVNEFDILRPDRCGSEPYMQLLSTSASDYNYNNRIRLSAPEVCHGGVLRISRAFNTIIDGMHCFDMGTITNHVIEIGQAGYLCQNTKIKDYQRNSGTLDSGKYDINCTDSNYTSIYNPSGVSSGLLIEINLNSEPNALVIGDTFATITNQPGDSFAKLNMSEGLSAPGLIIPSQDTVIKPVSGVLTISDSSHVIDTEAFAGTDDIDTINGGVDGQILILSSTANGRVATIKDGTGNCYLAGDFAHANTRDRLIIQFDSSIPGWVEVTRSTNS